MRMAESQMSWTYIVAELDASALMLVASSQVDAVSVSTIDGNDGRAVGSCQRTENGSELVSGPGLCIVLTWLILSAADKSALRCDESQLMLELERILMRYYCGSCLPSCDAGAFRRGEPVGRRSGC